MSEPVALVVDWVRCQGHGTCVELLPEVLERDDWGFPIVDSSPIEDETWLRQAKRAVATCPRLALLIEETAKPIQPE